MDDQKLVEALEECHKTLNHLEQANDHLQEENRHLRQAAGAFGQLAERLNKRLSEERRRADRRRRPRTTPDRRQVLEIDETTPRSKKDR
jgi:ABC-type transporter Mla subunit MlaD